MTDKEMLDWMTTQLKYRSDTYGDRWRLDVFIDGAKDQKPDIRDVIKDRMNHIEERGY